MRRIGVFTAGLALFLSGCSAVITDPNAGSIRDITVTVDDDGIPVIDYPIGREYSKVETEVLWSGKGDRLKPGDRILLDMYAVSLDTGAVLTDTFSDLPNAYILAPELVGQELYDVLAQERIGARILHLSPPVEGYEGQGAIALVVDVLLTKAAGESLPRRDDLPVVIVDDEGKPTIVIGENLTAPIGLEVATLIQGPGEQITPGSRIKVNFLAVSFETGEVFESSWDDSKGPMNAQVGVGELPLGWDQGLIDRTEGSQVLMVIPPELAYGEDTLVFVVDILAVRAPE
ncbi:MAG: FKBP-type peptidyl-prolyl cis-trans isomerase [Demequinaceae bacterium]|nr:FKBP-type peptidyl-prolyl cis-trans isomerase [Demequinaceae bacterium]